MWLLDRREQSPGARAVGRGRRLGGTPVERKEVAVGVGFAGAVTVSPPASMHTHFFIIIYLFFRRFTLGSSPHSLLLSEAANDGRRERS